MIEARLGRRNLTNDQRRLAIGRWYNRLKKKPGQHGPQPRNEIHENHVAHERGTAGRLAIEHGVSSSTVELAGKFAVEVEASPQLQQAIANKQSVRSVKARSASDLANSTSGTLPIVKSAGGPKKVLTWY